MRQQFPVVLKNLLATIDNKTQAGSYDGYGGCPLTVANGKVLLAEFRYDGEVVHSFNLDPRKPRRAYWWLKKTFFFSYLLECNVARQRLATSQT